MDLDYCCYDSLWPVDLDGYDAKEIGVIWNHNHFFQYSAISFCVLNFCFLCSNNIITCCKHLHGHKPLKTPLWYIIICEISTKLRSEHNIGLWFNCQCYQSVLIVLYHSSKVLLLVRWLIPLMPTHGTSHYFFPVPAPCHMQ